MSTSDADLQHRLRAMQAQFDNAEVGGGYPDPLEGIDDDDYQCRLESFEMFPGKKNPDAYYLKTMFSIQHNPELAGRELTTLHDVTDPEKMGFLKDHLHNLGVDVTQLDLGEVYPGSDLLRGLLDAWVLVGVYTSRKGGRYATVRQRLDGEVHSDLGTAQQQIAGFEGRDKVPTDAKPKPKPAKRGPSQAQQAANVEKKLGKPESCTCPDPTKGQFDEDCPVPGHGIGF
jgi:hypothetical protein